MHILLVEDSEDLGEAVATRLRLSGHAVEWVKDGSQASERASEEHFDGIVLDVMLPTMDGFAVLAELRRRRIGTPVLVITARSEIDDKVGLLDLGADDYLVKPFDLRELEARLRALLRRPVGVQASVARFGDVTIDSAGRSVTVSGRPIDIGRREFRLLEILLARQGQVLAKERLMIQLFGAEEVSPNALELQVSRLRRKLEGSAVEITTVRGVGYVAHCNDRP
jgi:two-component system response regulator TctD